MEVELPKKTFKPNYRKCFATFHAIIITLGSFQWGYSFTNYNVVSEVLTPRLDKDHQDVMMAVITTMIPAGAFIGAFSALFLISFGRKLMFVIANIVFIIGAGITLIENKIPIIIGRIFEGWSVGLFTVLCPLIIREATPIEISGMLGTLVMLQVTFGQLVAFALGFAVPDDPDTQMWRIIFGFPILVSIAQLLITLFYFYDTPLFYFMNGQNKKCGEALKQIYTDQQRIKEEIAELKYMVDNFEEQEDIPLLQIFHGHLLRPTLIGLALTFFQQWSGVPGIYFYSNSIFEGIGESILSSEITSLVMGALNCVFGIASIFLIDSINSMFYFIEIGRKWLLFGGSLGISVCLAVGGAVQLYDNDIVVDVFTIAAVCCFQISLGPVIWVYLSDILTDKALSLASVNNWGWIIVISVLVPFLMEYINIYGTYFLFMGMMAISAIFCFFLPETMGRSYTQIQAYFQGKDDLPLFEI